MRKTKLPLACAFVLALSPAARASEHGSEPAKAEHAAPEHGEEGSGHHKDESLVERPARQSSRDVKMPRALVARIEREYREFLTKQEVSLKENIRRRLMNVSVELTQKRQVALHENVRVVTPLGGGVIDLAEFVTPLKGGFRMRILGLNDKSEEIPGTRVFFVSRAKSRVIDGEEFGAGCDQYMEITTFYNKVMLPEGIELFTAEQRYLSVVGGTFVLVAFTKEELHVASVTFNDSRYPGRLCEI